MHSHWARLIEILHAAEKIKQLLHDPDLMEGELVTRGVKQFEGVGLIEAPRVHSSTIIRSGRMI